MNCTQCSELLVDYGRHQLSADSRAAVAAHLSDCNSCSAELAGLQQLGALLDLEEQPSAKLQRHFQARLAAELRHPGLVPA